MSGESRKKQEFYLLWNCNHKTINKTYTYPCWSGMLKYRNFHLYGVSSWFSSRKIIKIHALTAPIPFIRAIWYPVYLFNVDMSIRRKNIVIINEDHPCLENKGFLEHLKRKYDARLVIFAINQVRDKEKRPHWGARGQKIDDLKNQTDLIISTDYDDAQRFSIEYFPNVYSKIGFTEKNVTVDLYYTGRNKNGRERILKELAKRLDKAGIRFKISLTEVSESGKRIGIEEKALRSYPEILNEIQDANCLLEILENGQTSMTLRYMEALCYNKKLLTNNKNVVHLAGYDERYMRVFDPNHPEDIDIEFIRNRVDVRYDYHNEYSPVNFIKEVDILLKERGVV